MGSYSHFRPENVAIKGAKRIGVYNSDGNRVGQIPIGDLAMQDKKRLYSFGVVSDMHIGETEAGNENFRTALRYLAQNKEVEFILNCGDLIVWDTNSDNWEGYFKTYKQIVDECSGGKKIYSVSGNHELMKWVQTTNSGINRMSTLMEEYTGWKSSDENGLFLVDTFEPNGTDTFVLLSCYRYVATRKEYLEYKKEGLVFTSNDNESTIIAPEGTIWEFNSGDSIYISGCVANPNNNKLALIFSVKDNVMTFGAGAFEDATETAEVTIVRKALPLCQVYPMNNRTTEGVPIVSEGTVTEIVNLFETKRLEGKRLFVLHHVHLDESGYEDYEIVSDFPSSMYYLPISVFKDSMVFTGHTHYAFNRQEINKGTVYKNYRGFDLVHVPSVHDCCQGYVVDVYRDGVHVRGIDFSTGKDVPIASYWIDTTVN